MARSVRYFGNVYVWETSAPYRHEVERVLALVRSTQAGQALFRHVNLKRHWMLISPFRPTKGDPVNAYAQETSVADAAPKGYIADTAKISLPYLGPVEIPTVMGTGIGSTVNVIYHPATWHQRAKNAGGISAGAGAGEILFHEMIHGYREQSGLLRYRDRVTGEPSMDSVEEFYAILAANVYRSERGFSELRGGHHGFTAIKSDLRNQSSYYQNYKVYIDKWFSEQRAFCLDMARAPAKFNPFREAAVELRLIKGPAVSMRL